jgi:predicted TPR repeat methyltransferase
LIARSANRTPKVPQTPKEPVPISITTSDLLVRLPTIGEGEGPDQDREWCEVVVDGEPRRIRFHDYDEIFEIEGLYEKLFHDYLKCRSPEVVVGLLGRELRAAGVEPDTLRGLDAGAGNGMVGEELAALGVDSLVGVDLLPEAAAAAERDRPGRYDDYLVCDLTELAPDEERRLAAAEPNLLTTIAALGFGDVPCDAFVTAYDAVAEDGWVAFNIKDEFLEASDASGFAGLVKDMLADGVLEERARLRYPHRRSISGEELEYVAIVGVKRGDA